MSRVGCPVFLPPRPNDPWAEGMGALGPRNVRGASGRDNVRMVREFNRAPRSEDGLNRRQLEHQVFDRFLWDLLGHMPDTYADPGRKGRPAIPLRTQVLVAVAKVHLKEDTGDAHGLLIALNRDGKGILPRVPNYSIPSRFFNRP